MEHHLETLEELVSLLPDEIVTYFQEFDPTLQADGIGLFDLASATEITKDFHTWHPIVQALGGIILDDPCTSDHHIYLSVHPLKGMILALQHDGMTRVVFSSLAEFLDAAWEAVRREEFIDELHPVLSPLCDDQEALNSLIAKLIDDPNMDTLIYALIPSLDLERSTIAATLAAHQDFIFGQTLADGIVVRPSKKLRELAQLCSRHFHSQVRDAGKRALDAIAAIDSASPTGSKD